MFSYCSGWQERADHPSHSELDLRCSVWKDISSFNHKTAIYTEVE